MSNDSTGEPNINPYAPPLYELNPRPVETIHTKDRLPFEQLLNQLSQSPILATAHVWQFEFPANLDPVEEKPRSRNVRLAIVVAQLLWLVSLLIPQTRVLGILTFVFLALFSVFAFHEWTTPKNENFVSPAGVYSWLITDGGILVTTPAGGQWGIPWSRIHSITAVKGGWKLQTLSNQPHVWQMLLEGIEVDDAPLFLEVAYVFPELAAFGRPHPIVYAKPIEWTEPRTTLNGTGWSIVHDANQVWCDIGGIVIHLPSFELNMSDKFVALKDLHTGWTTNLDRQ